MTEVCDLQATPFDIAATGSGATRSCTSVPAQVCATLPAPEPRTVPARPQRVAWERFTEALAGFAPMPVTVTVSGDGPAAVLDAGVWARRVRPHPDAPSGSGILGALRCVANRVVPPLGFEVSVTAEVAELLALAHTVTADDDPRAVHTIGRLELTTAQLLRFSDLPVRVRVVEQLDTPRLPLRDRLRFGAGAEAGYHRFCARFGHDLVSADGAARPGEGTYGWAWFAHHERWGAGAERFCAPGAPGSGAGSHLGELRAALEALEAHPDRQVALTYDNNTVRAVGTGARPPTCEISERLAELCAERAGRGMPVVWFPLSASSGSRRQMLVDSMSGRAEHAFISGFTGVWSPESPFPELGFHRDHGTRHTHLNRNS